MADIPTFTIDNYGWVVSRDKNGGTLKSQSVEAQLLYAILQRLPDQSAPLGEPVEWESSDGLYRTTDRRKAENWAANIGVTVVRRAPVSATQGTSNGQEN